MFLRLFIHFFISQYLTALGLELLRQFRIYIRMCHAIYYHSFPSCFSISSVTFVP